MYFFPSPLHLQINLNLQYFCGFSCSLGLASVRPPHRGCRVHHYKSTHISMVMQTNFVNPIFRFVISSRSHINKRRLA